MYCVYLTIYRGNLLPPFYIGSTSVENVNNGYKGSVNSKMYGEIWKSELRESPHLFNVKILSYHETRKEAFNKERYLHLKLDVMNNCLYINQTVAQERYKKHSCADTLWINNGIKQKRIDIQKSIPTSWKFGKLPDSLETRLKKSRSKLGVPKPTQRGMTSVKDQFGNSMQVSTQDPRYLSGEVKGVNAGKRGMFDHINKTSFKCIHCGIETTKGNIKRWHDDNCKHRATLEFV